MLRFLLGMWELPSMRFYRELDEAEVEAYEMAKERERTTCREECRKLLLQIARQRE